MAASVPLSRRAFLAALSAGAVTAISAGALVGCGGGGSNGASTDATTAFRLSTRGVKGASKASKINAANKLFVSAAVANSGRAHPGDKSKVVSVDIGRARWLSYFGNGGNEVDLRAV